MTAAPSRRTCPSCAGSALVPVLHWPSVPVNAALFPGSEAESRAVRRGSLRLVACETCGLVFNADHDDALVEYSPRCVETQACSPTSRAFTDGLARGWVDRHHLEGADVVEVGCGPEASFLRTMCALTGARGIGIDPACTPGSDDVVTLLAERLDETHAELPGGALVCRHTLEHVADVGTFLSLLRAWAARRPVAPLLFELPDAGRIYREGAFWDVYYEHCSYFTAGALEDALGRAALAPGRVWSAYDGQYLVAEAHWAPQALPAAVDAAPAVTAAVAFGAGATERIARAHDALGRLARQGPVLLWQAGGKALAVLTLAGVDDHVTGVVDANPAKRGRYLPGTGRAILGPADVPALAPRHVVVMNAVYVEEVRRTLAEAGVTTDVSSFESLLDP